MENRTIKSRVRLIIIKNDRILLSYVKSENFHFFIGGKIEWGETIKNACIREIREECDATFTFKKILYLRDYIKPEENEHSIEVYVLGSVDKDEELEGLVDHQFGNDHNSTWVVLKKLESIDVRPKGLVKQILIDYKNGFKNGAVYIGEID